MNPNRRLVRHPPSPTIPNCQRLSCLVLGMRGEGQRYFDLGSRGRGFESRRSRVILLRSSAGRALLRCPTIPAHPSSFSALNSRGQRSRFPPIRMVLAMSRFQTPTRSRPGHDAATNLAGGKAFDRSLKVELAMLVLNSTVQDTFYESADTQLVRLAEIAAALAADGELGFCAKAAMFARREYGLRSISHALAGEVAHLRNEHPDQRGDWGAAFFNQVIKRPDDMSEIAGYWLAKYGPTDTRRKTLPAAMKRGFAARFESLKGESLSKWDGGSTRTLTLRQLPRPSRPQPAAPRVRPHPARRSRSPPAGAQGGAHWTPRSHAPCRGPRWRCP